MGLNQTKISKNTAAIALVFLLVAGLAVPVLAANGNVPVVVMEARSAVVRVVCEGEDFVAMGTGFAVGSTNSPYIVTNYHVIEDSKKVFLFYDTGKYVEGSIYKEYKDQDLAIIRPRESIPGLTVLRLADKNVDSGQAVYALGFPGAADILSSGFESEEYSSLQNLMDGVLADKQSMTITDGIISAIRTSKLIGYSGKDVKMVQTNTAINNGNSGGPLLNSSGAVVGVNTLGLAGLDTTEAMNGSVHVDELIRLLKRDKVPFGMASSKMASNGLGGASAPDGTMILVVSACLLVFLAAMVMLVFVARKTRNPRLEQEMSLLDWERGGFRMSEPEVQNKMMAFLQALLGAEIAGMDVYSLLTPENIVIGPKGIHLHKRKKTTENAGAIQLYPGYSAPESYDNQSNNASSVYFVGAMMALLLTGRRPENALRRKEKNEPHFAEPNPSTLRCIVNEAMNPSEYARVHGLVGLQHRLGSAMQAILAENAVAMGYYQGYPAPPAYGQPPLGAASLPYQPAEGYPKPQNQMPHAGQPPHGPHF